jgi:VanZ family protein
MFAVLAFFALYMLSCFEGIGKIKGFIYLTFLGLPVAAISEIIQMYLPGRTPALSDVGVDMIGYYIGAVVTLFLFLFVKIFKAIKNR